MAIGTWVRERLGPLEQPVSEAYRGAFINLDAFARALKKIVPSAGRVLEIGCGDGSVADRVSETYPGVGYVGIDVSADPGRRYTGAANAEFHSQYSSEYRATEPEPFDLTIVCDVLHHVPDDADRINLLDDARALTRPGGTILVKEWVRNGTLPYALGARSDRFVSGDRTVRFMDGPQLLSLIGQAIPGASATLAGTIAPWKCNELYAIRLPG